MQCSTHYSNPPIAPALAHRYGGERGSGNGTPYLYARFQKFSFPWGNAVGYFVQTTQNATWPEPNNVQLAYEIRGVTNDHQDTIVARFVSDTRGFRMDLICWTRSQQRANPRIVSEL